MSDEKPIAMTRRGNPRMVRGGPSLNPRGRPPKAFTASAIVASHIDADDVVRRMVSLLDHLSDKGQNHREQVALLSLIAGYVLGRPVNTVDLNVNQDDGGWHPPAGWGSWPQTRRTEYLLDLRRNALAGHVIDVGEDPEDESDESDGGDDE